MAFGVEVAAVDGICSGMGMFTSALEQRMASLILSTRESTLNRVCRD